MEKNADGYRVIFERDFPHDIMTVWEAITNPKKLAIWFMDVEMDLVVGARMIIRFRDNDRTETFGKVTRLEPGKIFEYIWENTDGPDELATWELLTKGPSACRLVLTYSKFSDRYVNTVPAGWHVLLDQLEAALNGRHEPFPETDAEEQKTLQEQYAEMVKNGVQ